jgi:hypothetical protein
MKTLYACHLGCLTLGFAKKTLFATQARIFLEPFLWKQKPAQPNDSSENITALQDERFLLSDSLFMV